MRRGIGPSRLLLRDSRGHVSQTVLYSVLYAAREKCYLQGASIPAGRTKRTRWKQRVFS